MSDEQRDRFPQNPVFVCRRASLSGFQEFEPGPIASTLGGSCKAAPCCELCRSCAGRGRISALRDGADAFVAPFRDRGRRTSSACWTFMTRSTSTSWWRSTATRLLSAIRSSHSALRNRREAGRLRSAHSSRLAAPGSQFEHHSLGAGDARHVHRPGDLPVLQQRRLDGSAASLRAVPARLAERPLQVTEALGSDSQLIPRHLHFFADQLSLAFCLAHTRLDFVPLLVTMNFRPTSRSTNHRYQGTNTRDSSLPRRCG